MKYIRSFYKVKSFIPREVQIFLRRQLARRVRQKNIETWPVLSGTERPPKNWQGWPGNKKFALVLTHDVETLKGHERCLQLMKIEQQLGFYSSFNFVPERYSDSPKLRQELINTNFEVGVHGLNHDGKLFSSRSIFQERAGKINHYLRLWNAVGFRAPSMHHNLEWISDLNIQYDLSTFDTDPFEPQSDGVETIFPFWVYNKKKNKWFLELPYTLPQDSTIFIILKEKTIDVWKRKLDWIANHGGMVLLNTHPDYMNFGTNKCPLEEYPVEFYIEFLDFVKTQYQDQYCNFLPKNLLDYCNKMWHTPDNQATNMGKDYAEIFHCNS